MSKKVVTVLLFVFVISLAFIAGDNDNKKAPRTNSTPNTEYKEYVYGPALNGPLTTLSESFESATFPPAGWVLINPISGSTGWNRQVAGATPVPGFGGGYITVPTGGGTAVAFGNYMTGNGSGGASGPCEQWLVTPQISNVQANDSLSFWLRKFGNYIDSFSVKISTTTPTVAGMTTIVNVRGFAAADSGWIQYKYKIGGLVPNGSNIYIGFREHIADVSLDGASFSLDLVNYTNAVLPPTTPVWTPQVSGVTSSLNCVSTVNANVGWIGGDAGVILLTTNAGTTWVSKANATVGANGVYAICGISATTCLVSTSPANTFVFKTTDGGTTWAQVFTQVGGFVDDIRMKDATTGFMYGDPVGTRWSLWKTTNAGTTWDSAGLYLPQAAAEAGWNNAMFIDGNAIWFGTNNTKVYKSINFGATGSWVSGATTGSANSYSVAFNNAKGFSGTSAAVVSTDAGLTYTATTFLGAGNIYAINAVKNTNKFWFERANIVYASTDNGTTWAAQYTGTAGVTYQAMSIVLSGSTLRGWTLSNTGEIIMFDQQNVVTGVNPVYTATTPNNYNLSQNYPNPFNPTTRINFALPKSGLVTLKVYNILGKEVATLVNEVKNIGTYSVDFNASNLSSGIYFYKLEVNGYSEVKKMSLIK